MATPNLPTRAANRLAEIQKQLESLQREKRELDSRRVAADRALRARRCVIVGSWLAVNEPATFERVVRALVRPQDLAAFGRSLAAADAAPATSDSNAFNPRNEAT